ncbi:cyclic peptide transporter [Paenibacillus alvei TS-15]|jgi:putative pyoverdin transport system ATP-binding/permease protein|uniref:Cyclic peptide transporter n=1 Tax=Paenibacillus alvei TS-15 TaxID=1117108 RepID=S9TZ58_PAEAL|nr:cyclic peptide transporter [Paenibacillus alvei TS-15]
MGCEKGWKSVLLTTSTNFFANATLSENANFPIISSAGLVEKGLIGVAAFFLVLIGAVLIQIIRRQRTFIPNTPVKTIVFHTLMCIVFVGLFTLCISYLPNVLSLSQGPPEFRETEKLLQNGLGMLYFGVLLFYLYLLLVFCFPKRNNDKSFIPITVLSIVSGFGGSLIIVILNQAIASRNIVWSLYFLLAIFISVYGGRTVRIKLIELMNRMVYEKRTSLIGSILKAPFYKMEKMDKGNIRACLNNDTEMISQFATEVVSIITNSITLLGCFLYLGALNFYALLFTVSVILVAATLYFITSRSAGAFWMKNRDIQNQFYKYIDDLINGFKELSLRSSKRNDFKKDIFQSCRDFYETRVRGEYKFINVSMFGDLLFVVVVGTIVFLFPLLFSDIMTDHLVTYVFTFLYMSGQVTALLGSIPRLTMIKISWERLNNTLKEIEQIEYTEDVEDTDCEKLNDMENEFIQLEFKDVSFQYDKGDKQSFTVGPFNYVFQSGEIVFITGGNGSGKSTLANLITGLYIPDKGEITLNGSRIKNHDLSEKFTTVFSDFYLFDKLYGIRHTDKNEEIQKYLKLLRMENKLSMEEGNFSTLMLSTGQKKRLALLISYLEDAPIFLFDEWAADQDPEFRKFFYDQLLPDLKKRGKCIIAITHDDAYFHVADKRIKLELGCIVTPNNSSEPIGV